MQDLRKLPIINISMVNRPLLRRYDEINIARNKIIFAITFVFFLPSFPFFFLFLIKSASLFNRRTVYILSINELP